MAAPAKRTPRHKVANASANTKTSSNISQHERLRKELENPSPKKEKLRALAKDGIPADLRAAFWSSYLSRGAGVPPDEAPVQIDSSLTTLVHAEAHRIENESRKRGFRGAGMTTLQDLVAPTVRSCARMGCTDGAAMLRLAAVLTGCGIPRERLQDCLEGLADSFAFKNTTAVHRTAPWMFSLAVQYTYPAAAAALREDTELLQRATRRSFPCLFSHLPQGTVEKLWDVLLVEDSPLFPVFLGAYLVSKSRMKETDITCEDALQIRDEDIDDVCDKAREMMDFFPIATRKTATVALCSERRLAEEALRHGPPGEIVPQTGAHELMQSMRFWSANHSRAAQSLHVILDTRSLAEFRRFRIASSFCISGSSLLLGKYACERSLEDSVFIEALRGNRIVVLGSGGDCERALTAARKLISLNFPYVSILSCSIDECAALAGGRSAMFQGSWSHVRDRTAMSSGGDVDENAFHAGDVCEEATIVAFAERNNARCFLCQIVMADASLHGALAILCDNTMIIAKSQTRPQLSVMEVILVAPIDTRLTWKYAEYSSDALHISAFNDNVGTSSLTLLGNNLGDLVAALEARALAAGSSAEETHRVAKALPANGISQRVPAPSSESSWDSDVSWSEQDIS